MQYNITLMNKNVKQKLDTFFQQFTKKNIPPKELLIQPTKEPVGLFYLTEGVVRHYSITQQGEEYTLNIYKPTSFFPVAWIVDESIDLHYFETMTPATVWIAPKSDTVAFLKKEPDILFDLIQRMNKGLDGYYKKIEQLLLGKAKEKLIIELLLYANRFGKEQDNAIEIPIKITEKQLASQTGLARETVSRELQKLIHLSLIQVRDKGITITNKSKLEKELYKEM